MEGINKKYNIEIEVLTPLSIGAGQEKDWVRGIDFVVDNGNLYKLNMKKMVAVGVKPEELSSFFATKDEECLIRKLGGNLTSVSDFCIPISVQSDNDIKSFVKNQLSGNPVLTGSSMKGSIRSVLFQYLGGNSNNGKEVFGSSAEGDEFMRFIKISDAEFEGASLVNTKVFNLRKSQNEWLGGWKHQQTDSANSFTNDIFNPLGFNTLYECLMPKQKGYASFMLSERTFDNFNLAVFYKKKMADLQSQLNRERRDEKKKDWKKKINSIAVISSKVEAKSHALSLSNLFSIINQHTRNYLKKERRFFEKYAADRTDDIIASIDTLICQIPADNSYCILRMSAGSGFHSITGDWQFEDFTEGPLDRKRVRVGKVNPKSRKIAVWNDKLSLMGFVKLSAVSEEEIKQAEELRKVEARQKQEEMRKKAEQEAKIQRELEERQKLYDFQILEVKQLVDNERYELALEKYQNICETFPEHRQRIVDVEDLQVKVELIKSERQLKENEEIKKQARMQAQQKKAEGGLAKLLNEKYEFGPKKGNYMVTSFKVCSQKVNSWMKAAGVVELPEEHHEALRETLFRIAVISDKKDLKSWTDINSNIWKTVSSWISYNIAAKWYKELFDKLM